MFTGGGCCFLLFFSRVVHNGQTFPPLRFSDFTLSDWITGGLWFLGVVNRGLSIIDKPFLTFGK